MSDFHRPTSPFRFSRVVLRTVSGALSFVVFFTQVLFAHVPTLSVWESRREAARRMEGSDGKSPAAQLAFLDTSLNAARIPAISLSATLAPRLPARTPDQLLQPITDAVAAAGNNATLQEVRLPESGPVRGAVPVIVLLQDVHGHAEAQRNIAEVLSHFHRKMPSAIVALEAAAGDIDASRFRGPDAGANRFVAETLFSQKIIAGPELAALGDAEPLPLFGAEDRALYLANVSAVRAALPKKESMQAAVRALRADLDASAARTFSPDLRSFVADEDAFDDGSLPLPIFLARLSQRPGFVPAAYPELRNLLAALSLESRINTRAVEDERAALVSQLAAQLPRRDLEALLSAGVALKAGRLDVAGFHTILADEARRAGVPLAAYPDLALYLDYLGRADRINAGRVLEDCRRAQTTVGEALCRTAAQRALLRRRDDARLLARLTSLTLRSAEWSRLAGRFDSFVGDAGLEPAARASLAAFRDFYAAADARSQAIAAHLTRRMQEARTRVGLLVSGGFHTDGIAERLVANGDAVVILSPRLADVNDPGVADYLSVFTRERTPLAKIFETPRLSLAMTPAIAPIAPGLNDIDLQRLDGELRGLRVVFRDRATDGNEAAVIQLLKNRLRNDPEAYASLRYGTLRFDGDDLVARIPGAHPHTIRLSPSPRGEPVVTITAGALQDPSDADSFELVYWFVRLLQSYLADGRIHTFSIIPTISLRGYPVFAPQVEAVYAYARDHRMSGTIRHAMYLPPAFPMAALPALTMFLEHFRDAMDVNILTLVESKLADAIDADALWRKQAAALGLSDEEIAALERYTDRFLFDHRTTVERDRDALLRDLINPSVIALSLNPVSIHMDWAHRLRLYFEEWRAGYLRPFSTYHREYLNGLPSDIRLKLFRAKFLSPERQTAIRRFLGEDGGELKLVDIADVSSGRGHPNKGPVYRLTFEHAGGRTTTIYLKTYLRDGSGRGGVAARSAYEPVYYAAASLVSLTSTVARYVRDRSDSKLDGYVLTDAISGVPTNGLFTGRGADRRLDPQFAPHAVALIQGLARWAALSDALMGADRSSVPFVFESNPANFLVDVDALKTDAADSVVSIDHEYLFNADDRGFLSYIARFGACEMGVLLALDDGQSAPGFARVSAVYEAAYRAQWALLQKNRAPLERRIAETFGESSEQLNRLRTSLDTDPSVRLERQRAALLLFAAGQPTFSSWAGRELEREFDSLSSVMTADDAWFHQNPVVQRLEPSTPAGRSALTKDDTYAYKRHWWKWAVEIFIAPWYEATDTFDPQEFLNAHPAAGRWAAFTRTLGVYFITTGIALTPLVLGLLLAMPAHQPVFSALSGLSLSVASVASGILLKNDQRPNTVRARVALRTDGWPMILHEPEQRRRLSRFERVLLRIVSSPSYAGSFTTHLLHNVFSNVTRVFALVRLGWLRVAPLAKSPPIDWNANAIMSDDGHGNPLTLIWTASSAWIDRLTAMLRGKSPAFGQNYLRKFGGRLRRHLLRIVEKLPHVERGNAVLDRAVEAAAGLQPIIAGRPSVLSTLASGQRDESARRVLSWLASRVDAASAMGRSFHQGHDEIFRLDSTGFLALVAEHPESVHLFLDPRVLDALMEADKGPPYVFVLTCRLIASEPNYARDIIFVENHISVRSLDSIGTAVNALAAREHGGSTPSTPEEMERLRASRIDALKRFLEGGTVKSFLAFLSVPFYSEAAKRGAPASLIASTERMMENVTGVSNAVFRLVYEINEDYLIELFGIPDQPGAVLLGGAHARKEVPTYDHDAYIAYRGDGLTSGGPEGQITNREFYDRLAQLLEQSLERIGREFDQRFQTSAFSDVAPERDGAWAMSIDQMEESTARSYGERFLTVIAWTILDFAAGDPELAHDLAERLQNKAHDERAVRLAIAAMHLAFDTLVVPTSGAPLNLKTGRGGLRAVQFAVWHALLIDRLAALKTGRAWKAPTHTSTLQLIQHLVGDKQMRRELSQDFSFLLHIRVLLDFFYGRNDKIIPDDAEVYSRMAGLTGFRSGFALERRLRQAMSRIHQNTERLINLPWAVPNDHVPLTRAELDKAIREVEKFSADEEAAEQERLAKSQKVREAEEAQQRLTEKLQRRTDIDPMMAERWARRALDEGYRMGDDDGMLTTAATYAKRAGKPRWVIEQFYAPWDEATDTFHPVDFWASHEPAGAWAAITRAIGTFAILVGMIATPIVLGTLVAVHLQWTNPLAWGIFFASISFMAGRALKWEKEAPVATRGERVLFFVLASPSYLGSFVIHFLYNLISNIMRLPVLRWIRFASLLARDPSDQLNSTERSALRFYQSNRALQEYEPTSRIETLHWLADHRAELGGKSLHYLVRALAVAGRIPEGEKVLAWELSAAAYDFFLGSELLRSFQPQNLQATLQWLHDHRAELGGNSLSYLIRGLALAGRLPENTSDETWTRAAGAYELYLQSDLLRSYEPRNLEDTLRWLADHRAELGGDSLVYLVQGLAAAGRLPINENQERWQRAAAALDFYLASELLQSHDPQTIETTLRWLADHRTQLGGNSLGYLVQALVIAGRVPESQNSQIWERSAGAFDFYLHSDLLRSYQPQNLETTLHWLNEHRAELGGNSLGYLVQALALAGRLPPGETEGRWRSEAAAFDRALNGREGLSNEIRRIWGQTPLRKYRTPLARLKAELDPTTLPNLQTGAPLSPRYRDSILSWAYKLYGEQLIQQLNRGGSALTTAATYAKRAGKPRWVIEQFYAPWDEATGTFHPVDFWASHEPAGAWAAITRAIGTFAIVVGMIATPVVLGTLVAVHLQWTNPLAWGIFVASISFMAGRALKWEKEAPVAMRGERVLFFVLASPSYLGSFVIHFLYNLISNIMRLPVLRWIRFASLSLVPTRLEQRAALARNIETMSADAPLVEWSRTLEEAAHLGLPRVAVRRLPELLPRFGNDLTFVRRAAEMYHQAAELAVIRGRPGRAREMIQQAVSLITPHDPHGPLIRRRYDQIMGVTAAPRSDEHSVPVVQSWNPSVRRVLRIDPDSWTHLTRRHVELLEGNGSQSFFPADLSTDELKELLFRAMRFGVSMQPANPLWNDHKLVYHLTREEARRFGVRRVFIVFDENGVVTTAFPTAGQRARFFRSGRPVDDIHSNMRADGGFYWNKHDTHPIVTWWGTPEWGFRAAIEDRSGLLQNLSLSEREAFLWEALREGRPDGENNGDLVYRVHLEETSWAGRLGTGSLYFTIDKEQFAFRALTAHRPGTIFTPSDESRRSPAETAREARRQCYAANAEKGWAFPYDEASLQGVLARPIAVDQATPERSLVSTLPRDARAADAREKIGRFIERLRQTQAARNGKVLFNADQTFGTFDLHLTWLSAGAVGALGNHIEAVPAAAQAEHPVPVDFQGAFISPADGRVNIAGYDDNDGIVRFRHRVTGQPQAAPVVHVSVATVVRPLDEAERDEWIRTVHEAGDEAFGHVDVDEVSLIEHRNHLLRGARRIYDQKLGESPRAVESLLELVERRIPAEHRNRWDAPNHNYAELTGRPVLHDHLQLLLDVLNRPYDYAQIPPAYQAMLADPANRNFFELFILLHDWSKRTMAPAFRKDSTGKIVGVEYAGHEAVSYEQIIAEPALQPLLDSLGPDRDLFLEVVRLHGLPRIEDPDALMAEMLSRLRPGIDPQRFFPFLIASCATDALAPSDPVFQRFGAARINTLARGFARWRGDRMSLFHGPESYEKYVAPGWESPIVAAVVFSLSWLMVAVLAVMGVDFSDAVVFYAGAFVSFWLALLTGSVVSDLYADLHRAVGRQVGEAPLKAHMVGVAFAFFTAIALGVMRAAGVWPISLPVFVLAAMMAYAVGHTVFHYAHNITNPSINRMTMNVPEETQEAYEKLPDALRAKLPVAVFAQMLNVPTGSSPQRHVQNVVASNRKKISGGKMSDAERALIVDVIRARTEAAATAEAERRRSLAGPGRVFYAAIAHQVPKDFDGPLADLERALDARPQPRRPVTLLVDYVGPSFPGIDQFPAALQPVLMDELRADAAREARRALWSADGVLAVAERRPEIRDFLRDYFNAANRRFVNMGAGLENGVPPSFRMNQAMMRLVDWAGRRRVRIVPEAPSFKAWTHWHAALSLQNRGLLIARDGLRTPAERHLFLTLMRGYNDNMRLNYTERTAAMVEQARAIGASGRDVALFYGLSHTRIMDQLRAAGAQAEELPSSLNHTLADWTVGSFGLAERMERGERFTEEEEELIYLLTPVQNRLLTLADDAGHRRSQRAVHTTRRLLSLWNRQEALAFVALPPDQMEPRLREWISTAPSITPEEAAMFGVTRAAAGSTAPTTPAPIASLPAPTETDLSFYGIDPQRSLDQNLRQAHADYDSDLNDLRALIGRALDRLAAGNVTVNRTRDIFRAIEEPLRPVYRRMQRDIKRLALLENSLGEFGSTGLYPAEDCGLCTVVIYHLLALIREKGLTTKLEAESESMGPSPQRVFHSFVSITAKSGNKRHRLAVDLTSGQMFSPDHSQVTVDDRGRYVARLTEVHDQRRVRDGPERNDYRRRSLDQRALFESLISQIDRLPHAAPPAPTRPVAPTPAAPAGLRPGVIWDIPPGTADRVRARVDALFAAHPGALSPEGQEVRRLLESVNPTEDAPLVFAPTNRPSALQTVPIDRPVNVRGRRVTQGNIIYLGSRLDHNITDEASIDMAIAHELGHLNEDREHADQLEARMDLMGVMDLALNGPSVEIAHYLIQAILDGEVVRWQQLNGYPLSAANYVRNSVRLVRNRGNDPDRSMPGELFFYALDYIRARGAPNEHELTEAYGAYVPGALLDAVRKAIGQTFAPLIESGDWTNPAVFNAMLRELVKQTLDRRGPMSLISGPDWYEKYVAPLWESPLLAAIIFAGPALFLLWATGLPLHSLGANLDRFFAAAIFLSTGHVLSEEMAHLFKALHTRLGRRVGDAPLRGHDYAITAACVMMLALLASARFGLFEPSIPLILGLIAATFAAVHTVHHLIHNITHPSDERMSVLRSDRQRATAFLTALVETMPVNTNLVSEGMNFNETARLVRDRETLDGAVARVRARGIMEVFGTDGARQDAASVDEAATLASRLGRFGADWSTARAVVRTFSRDHQLPYRSAEAWTLWARGRMDGELANARHHRGLSVADGTPDAATLKDPSTVVAFDVAPFTADDARDPVAEEHLLNRARGVKDRTQGDALIYLLAAGESRDDVEARITKNALAAARRAGRESEMKAYLAASRFVAFEAATYDPRAVFSASVEALFDLRGAAAIASVVNSHHLSILTDSAARVSMDDPVRGIEIYLLEAGLRAVPAFHALNEEMNAIRAVATNA